MNRWERTYKERVDELYNYLYPTIGLQNDVYCQKTMDTAKLMITAQAESVKEALTTVLLNEGYKLKYATDLVTDYLLEYGYVESKTEDDGNI